MTARTTVVMSSPVDTFTPTTTMCTADAPDDLLDRIATLARTRRSALAAAARAEGLSPEDAVDCVQEGFCALFTTARRGEAPDTDEALFALVVTRVRNLARNRRRRHFVARPHVALDDHEARDETPAADEAMAHAEAHTRLRACVAGLCEIQKAVVTLRMLEELPGDDVARALGITSNHVAVLLHRARRALRVCMDTP